MNNNVFTFLAILVITIATTVPSYAQYAGTVTDSVFMGPSYVNEIYYSMATGNKGVVKRNQWDIAFRANRMSASILTNDASGVELYTIPKGNISNWANIDTTGVYLVKNMVNSTTDWEDGAFCRNQKGHPDYGWGKYNAITHDVVGDSVYLIKLLDGSLRKLWIIRKYSSSNMIEIRYANLNGTKDTTIMVDCNPYAEKNFVGFSIAANKVVDFEPAVSSQWDILFTKYMYTYPAGTSTPGALYPVTGVLSNYKVKVKKYEHVPPSFIITQPQIMDSTRSPIGWEWKKLNNATFAYEIVDSLVYFVQDRGGKIHKLVFKKFSGGSTGRIVFQKEVISFTGIDDMEKSGFNAAVYPNPVSNVMNLVLNPGKSRSAIVTLLDMSGRKVLTQRYELQANELSTVKIPVAGLRAGIYMVQIQSGTNVISRKIIVNN